MEIQQSINNISREALSEDLNNKGYALVKGILTSEECADSIALYHNDGLYRKTVVMARHGYGLGEYKYFQYPLPGLIAHLRENMYPLLAPIANHWMRVLNIDKQFPESLKDLMELCQANNQHRPTPLILKYETGGYNALHQDLYGEVYFPMQLVLFLNEPGQDYEGGEFVLIEQKPRAQSKAIVLKPRKGDMLVFTTNFRPGKSTRGYYRANMKHGVSEITAGQRHTLGIIFHDAT